MLMVEMTRVRAILSLLLQIKDLTKPCNNYLKKMIRINSQTLRLQLKLPLNP